MRFPRRLGRVALEHAGVLAGFSALTALLTWPWVLNFDTHTAEVGVDDPLFYTRMVRHFFAWLDGQRSGLLDVDFFWPHPQALTTNDVSLGLLYGSLPFRPFTDNLLTLVNLGFFVTFVLTGHATYLLSKELTHSRWAGWVGGAAFTFCLFRFHQFDHQNVLNMQWGVYTVYALVLLQRKPSVGPMLGLAVALFFHATASMNIALYSVFALLMLGAFLLVGTPAEKRPSFLVWATLGCALTALAVLPIYLPYFEARARTGMTRALGEILMYSGRLEQLAAAPAANALYGVRLSPLLGRESLTFPGVVVLLLAAVGVGWSVWEGLKEVRKERALLWSIAALTMTALVGILCLFHRTAALLWVVVLFGLSLFWARRNHRSAAWATVLLSMGFFYLYASLGPQIRWNHVVHGPGLWEWFSALPGFSWVRTPARFFFETSFALALLAAMGVALARKAFQKTWQGQVFSAVALLSVLLEFNAAPMPLRKMRTLDQAPPVYSWLAQQPGNHAVLELPVFHLYERYRMYFSTLHNRPTLDGESGYLPPVMHWVSTQSFANREAIDHLKRLRSAGLEFVVLHEAEVGGFSSRFKEVLTEAGGQEVIRFGTDAVWRMPVASTTKAFAPENIDSTIRDSRLTPQGLEVILSMTVRGPEGVFEYRNTQLRLQLKEAPQIHAVAHFAPPLFAPGLTNSLKATLPLKTETLPSPCTLELVDDMGAVWASRPCVK